MANELKGVDVLIKKDGVAIAGQRDATLNIQGDKIDTSTKTNQGWKTSLQGLKEWSISLDAVNYIGADAVGQRALRKAFLDGQNVDVVFAMGEEEVYIGEAAITGLDLSGQMSDVSTSSFTLDGAGPLDYEYAPAVASVAVSGSNKVATITFTEEIASNVADAPALKAAVTFASNGTTFAALAVADTVAVTSGKLVVTFDSAFAGSANKLKVAARTLKSTNGAIQTIEQITGAFAAAT
jgi:TP901-1 family phage major tail protein